MGSKSPYLCIIGAGEDKSVPRDCHFQQQYCISRNMPLVCIYFGHDLCCSPTFQPKCAPQAAGGNKKLIKTMFDKLFHGEMISVWAGSRRDGRSQSAILSSLCHPIHGSQKLEGKGTLKQSRNQPQLSSQPLSNDLIDSKWKLDQRGVLRGVFVLPT